MWSGNVAWGRLKACLTYIIMHNWQRKQKQCNSCAPSQTWQLWKSKNRNMQEPTIESLSAGIQLWHTSTEIYADWSRLLRAIEMWSRGGQHVLWFEIKRISIKIPTKTWCSSNLASEMWVLMDFQRSGGLLIWYKLLFRWVHWIPVHHNLMYRLLQIWHQMSELEVLDDVLFGCIWSCDCWWLSPAACIYAG